LDSVKDNSHFTIFKEEKKKTVKEKRTKGQTKAKKKSKKPTKQQKIKGKLSKF
jgi:hypothetical protein